MFDGEWRHIPYTEIVSIVRESTKDVTADDLRLELRTQTSTTMLVNGKDVERGTHDKYMVMMFLDSVIGPEVPSH